LPDKQREKRRSNNSKKSTLEKVMVKILKINQQTQSQSQGLQDRKILKTLNKKEMMIVKER